MFKSRIRSTWAVLAVFLGVVASCQTPQKEARQNQPTPPNIVLILADDMGLAQLGCYGNSYYETPHLNRLASEGMLFTQAYASAPVCSPTRAALMTGKYPARLHITDFIAGSQAPDSLLEQPDWQKFLPLEEITIAEKLKEAGYATALFGKWHLSRGKRPPASLPHNPDKQGFDESYIVDKPAENLKDPVDAHHVAALTQRSVAFMEKNRHQPFFLFLSHSTIHDPLYEEASLIQKYETKTGADLPPNHPVLGAMVETLDKSVGTILQKLQDLGLEENTVVIFYADNGGKNAYAEQVPFRGGKGWLYEGGIREPLIFRWPGRIKAQSSTDAMVSTIDFFPTFAAMAGVSVSHSIDGTSFLPVLEGKAKFPREENYFHYPHYHNEIMASQIQHGSGVTPSGAVRAGDYKLIEWFEASLSGRGSPFELYNLNEDIAEQHDLAAAMPEKVEELRRKLHQWREEVGAQMPTLRNPNP